MFEERQGGVREGQEDELACRRWDGTTPDGRGLDGDPRYPSPRVLRQTIGFTAPSHPPIAAGSNSPIG
jgi:hypothetical protein